MILLASIFVVATVASLAGGRFVRRMATARGAVIPPRADRWHSAPTPTMGGIAIVAGLLLLGAMSKSRAERLERGEVYS